MRLKNKQLSQKKLSHKEINRQFLMLTVERFGNRVQFTFNV